MSSSKKVPSEISSKNKTKSSSKKLSSKATGESKKGRGKKRDGASKKMSVAVASNIGDPAFGREDYPDGFVLPVSDIHSTVDKTCVLYVKETCRAMRKFIEVCQAALDEPQPGFDDRLDSLAVQRIERSPKWDEDRGLRRLLDRIEIATYGGPEGIKAAKDTAYEFIQYANRYSGPWGRQQLYADFEKMMKEAGLAHLLIGLKQAGESD